MKHKNNFWLVNLSLINLLKNLKNLNKKKTKKLKNGGQLNEILFSKFGINYNNEPLIYKKGTIIYKNKVNKKFRVYLLLLF
jgi:tRNA(His) guanylyltransferase